MDFLSFAIECTNLPKYLKHTMHDIEPFFKWREKYVAADDSKSPFYGKQYDEFKFSNKIYNYFIHPQWDFFGSQTMYLKVIFVDYDAHFAIIEFIGEWNDCIGNDIMYLKRDVMDALVDEGIYKFVLIGENVLNFHGSDDCYYEEWYQDICEYGGWISMLNMQDHVIDEMRETKLNHFLNFGDNLNEINWRKMLPSSLLLLIEEKRHLQTRSLG